MQILRPAGICDDYDSTKFDGDTLIEVLNMDGTLSDNGIPDETDRLECVELDNTDSTHMPTLLLYFNDDITYA